MALALNPRGFQPIPTHPTYEATAVDDTPFWLRQEAFG
jgi:hypothetical protein